jgi:hypothetical protein
MTDGIFAKRLARRLSDRELDAVAGGVIMDNTTLKHTTCAAGGGEDGAIGVSDGIIYF